MPLYNSNVSGAGTELLNTYSPPVRQNVFRVAGQATTAPAPTALAPRVSPGPPPAASKVPAWAWAAGGVGVLALGFVGWKVLGKKGKR